MRDTTPRLALVSMPWMAANMPSIQLATLSAVLSAEELACDCHELYVDYAAAIGWPLYRRLSGGSGFVEEWLFAKHYFGPESGADLDAFREHRPKLGIGSQTTEDRLLDVLVEVTGQYLERLSGRIHWDRYDIVGFSLTIAQTTASMALARLIKRAHPRITIVFGGTACAGPMGPALARVCPYVDFVVGVEGEPVLPELVRRIRRGSPVSDLPGVSWRSGDGTIDQSEARLVYRDIDKRPMLRFDSYFARLAALGLRDDIGGLNIWLPFESSRGCWYGEKVQCTFCGLHEIMQFRHRPWISVLEELEDWSERYGIRQFFAVDLIMPRDHPRTLLPEIARRGHDWTIFYEIKASASRPELESLRHAGVSWIQPGLESLDDDALKAMRKGVSVMVNVQLLKWCEELGITVTWNIITGVPGENPASYHDMAQRMRLLFHLMPPSGAHEFELHRFSPYFDSPRDFGIEPGEAHALYAHVYPVDQRDRNDLAYRFEYTLSVPRPAEASQNLLKRAIKDWKAARHRGAALELTVDTNGAATIVDTRTTSMKRYELPVPETELYTHFDTPTSRDAAESSFAKAHPSSFAELQSRGGIQATLDSWIGWGLVLAYNGRVLALATHAARRWRGAGGQDVVAAAPVSYLTA
jgi:ribosomal peptide maturation radical SAM protein 1